MGSYTESFYAKLVFGVPLGSNKQLVGFLSNLPMFEFVLERYKKDHTEMWKTFGTPDKFVKSDDEITNEIVENYGIDIRLILEDYIKSKISPDVEFEVIEYGDSEYGQELGISLVFKQISGEYSWSPVTSNFKIHGAWYEAARLILDVIGLPYEAPVWHAVVNST